MDQKHKTIIQKNFVELVQRANLSELLPKLIAKGVFSTRLAEPYEINNMPEMDRKRQLFFNILRRGPQAFDNLVESLKEIDDYDHCVLASLLEGKELPVYQHKSPPKNVSCQNQNLNNMECDEEEMDESSSIPQSSGTNPFKLVENQRPNHIRQLSQESPHMNINLGDEPIKISVTKSTQFCDDPRTSKVPIYPMRSSCRGIFLGINNVEFVNNVMSYRTGAQVDEENLKELFKQMGFNIHSYRNQTFYDMKTTITDFASSKHNPMLKRADCLVVAIMSHGEEGETKESSHVIASDGRSLSVSWILDQFNNVNCPDFQNKPKIFIFQICRGDNMHPGVPVPRIQNRIQSDGVNVTAGHVIRNMTDMLIAFSTLPGDRSYRDVHLGTWYIQLICEVFMRHAFDTDVEHLLKMVDEQLQNLRSEDGNMQTSSYESRGFKRCYLNPGLYE